MQTSSANKKLFSFNGYFLSQPHQPFFTSGVILAIVLMLMFGLAHKGVVNLTVSPNDFHVYGLIYLVFSQFYIGFLFTTFPRFCQSKEIEKGHYAQIFMIYQVGALTFIAGALFDPILAVASVAMAFLAHLWALLTLQRIYRASNPALRTDPF